VKASSISKTSLVKHNIPIKENNISSCNRKKSIKVISREDDIVIFIFQGMIQTFTYNIYNLKQISFVHINMAYTMKEFNFVLHIFMLLIFQCKDNIPFQK
jgi:hypothetical protein